MTMLPRTAVLSLFLLTMLVLAACTPKTTPAPLGPTAEECPTVYTYAPGNYIIDIASDAEVVLDPLMQDFKLFCSPEEARRELQAQVDKGLLPAGDWRIYVLDGTLEDLGQRSGHNEYTLKRMAQMVDWVLE